MKAPTGIIFFICLLKVSIALPQISDELIKDIDSYCQYLTEKNNAQRLLLNSPDAITRFDNGDVYNNLQKVIMVGLSKNLSDFAKAKAVRQIIQDECRYYQVNQEAKLQIKYALASIRYQSLQFKRQQIIYAKTKLTYLLSAIEKRIEHHNDTIKSYHQIDSSLQKLMDIEQQIHIDLASEPLPKTKFVKINGLIQQLVNAQNNRQHSLNHLKKQDNWSLQIQAGAQQNLSTPQNQDVKPYFSVSFRYNLGSLYSNSQIKKAEEYYADWQKAAIFGTQKQLIQLLSVFNALEIAEKKRLAFLTKTEKKTEILQKRFNSINTNKAILFQNQLEVDKLLKHIEIEYVKHTIKLLQYAQS